METGSYLLTGVLRGRFYSTTHKWSCNECKAQKKLFRAKSFRKMARRGSIPEPVPIPHWLKRPEVRIKISMRWLGCQSGADKPPDCAFLTDRKCERRTCPMNIWKI